MVYFMFFGVKRVLWYALHISFPSSEDLMSTWHWEKEKFAAVFVLDLLLYYWLFINLPMSTESEFAFLKTAKVIFVWYTPEIFLKIIKIHHFPCWRLQWSKLRSVIGHDRPDFKFDRTIFSWNSQKWPITEWDYLDPEVWQTACVWHGRWNEKKKVF